MVKKTTTKKTSTKSTSAKKTVVKKPAVKRTVRKAVASQKVDYYPNRMTVAISALAGTLLVLFALISVLGSR